MLIDFKDEDFHSKVKNEEVSILQFSASRGQPWIFEDLNYYYKTGKKNKPLEKNKVHDIMLEHLLGLYQFYGDTTGVRVDRKHLVWY